MNPANPTDEPSLRDTYSERVIDGTLFALISDPRNEHAWILSDRMVSVEP